MIWLTNKILNFLLVRLKKIGVSMYIVPDMKHKMFSSFIIIYKEIDANIKTFLSFFYVNTYKIHTFFTVYKAKNYYYCMWAFMYK